MIEVAPFLAALLAAALVRHLAMRVIVNKYYPIFERDKRRRERAKVRIDAMDTAEMTQQKVADETLRIHKEEGLSMRPAASFVGVQLSLWALAVVVMWFAALSYGGLFAAAVWWAPVAYLGAKLLVLLPASFVKQRETISRFGPKGQAGIVGCSTLFLVVLMLPVTILYASAPVGVTVFVAISWCVSWVLWRLFPYAKGDLPKVAMLFL